MDLSFQIEFRISNRKMVISIQKVLQQLMNESNAFSNKCLDCGLNFSTPNELINHKRRFCINSGYDNLEGLAKIQFNGVNPIHQPKMGHKNYLQQYGANSLSKVSDYDNLNASVLEKDMKNVNNFKRQLQGVQKYKHKSQIDQSQVSSNKGSRLNQTRLTNNAYSQSRLDEELKRYQKLPKEDSISPPTFIDQMNMRNHTVLDKSNSSMGRMAKKDRLEYAKVKLDELNEIKEMYTKNGGNRKDFKGNVDRMIDFYQKFLKENEGTGTNDGDEDSLNFIESRVSTPILKLRDLQGSRQSQKGRRSDAKKQQPIKKSAANKLNDPAVSPYNPYPYAQPQVIMMPYPPPTQPSTTPNDSMRLLEKMIELKSEENQKLLEILLEQKKKGNQPQPPPYMLYPQFSNFPNQQPTSLPLMSNLPDKSNMSKKGQIDASADYQFKKSMIDDLISEQKVLLALQQQELDEMKLLSQLPKDLQQIKLKSAIKSSETRHQVQKEILRQKMDRLAYQQANQSFEEQRKLNNDRWAGQQRKKLLQKQMNRYVNNFQSEFLAPNSYQ